MPVRVVPALPVVAAAGVLVDLQQAADKQAWFFLRVRAPMNRAIALVRQRQVYAQIAKEERARIAQVPDSAAMPRATGIVNRQANRDESGAGEEGEAGAERQPAPAVEASGQNYGCPECGGRFQSSLMHARSSGPALRIIQDRLSRRDSALFPFHPNR